MYMVLAIQSKQYAFPIISPKNNPIISFTKQLLDYSLNDESSKLSIVYLFMALGASGRAYRAEGVDPDFLKLYEDVLNIYYVKHNCIGKNLRGHGLVNTGFSFYHQLYYLSDTSMRSPFTIAIIKDAIINKKREFLRNYILEASDASPERKAWAFLRALRPILEDVNKIDDAEFKSYLENCLIDGLSRLRIFAPQETDQLFESIDTHNKSLSKIQQLVQAGDKRETVGSLFMGRAVWLIGDLINSRENNVILDLLVWWINQAAYCTNISTWFSLLVKLIINFIYLPDNVQIFKNPDIRKILNNKQDGGI